MSNILESPSASHGLESLIGILQYEDKQFESFKNNAGRQIIEAYESNDIKLAMRSEVTNPNFDLSTARNLIDEFIEKLSDGLSESKQEFVNLIFNKYFELLSNIAMGREEFYDCEIPIQLLHENAKVPVYAHITDDGADIFATEDFIIPEQARGLLIQTGFAISVPIGWKISVKPKSGISKNTNLRISNSPGTVDAAYLDPVGVLIDNFGPQVTIPKSSKFCQISLERSYRAKFTIVNDIRAAATNDRNGGFGSTTLYAQ